MVRGDAVPPTGNQADAAVELVSLGSQATAIRLELKKLREQLALLRNEDKAAEMTSLQTANEKLFIAALNATAVADSAKESLAKLTRSCQRDALTNTPNRALTLERLEQAIGMASRHDASLAVYFLDIDNLKSINDSFGHAIGDAALQLTARRLESVVRSTDTVSRHGGDEFVILISELSDTSAAADIAVKMLEALAMPAQLGGHAISISASIGVAVFPADATTGEELIEIADSAMYVVKRGGGCAFGFSGSTAGADLALLSGSGNTRSVEQSDQQSMAQLKSANEQLVMASLAALELRELAEESLGNEVKFMAMVAHELRTPLTPIRMAADMLGLVGDDEQKLKRLQGIIKDEVDQLVYLIEDLLDASRITTGKLRMNMEQVDVAAVLSATVEATDSCFTERSQTITCSLPAAPVLIRGNKARLKQVFCNLFENASKYTPPGGHIRVDLELHEDELTVEVSDDGVGIPPHALPHIFDLFVQEAGAVALHSGGLGIGLALVQEIVFAHNGAIVAKSEGRGQGSSFIVTLPLS